MHIYDLDTPALVIDLDVLERNIRAMAAHCIGGFLPSCDSLRYDEVIVHLGSH